MKKGLFAIQIIFKIRRQDNGGSVGRNFELLGLTRLSQGGVYLLSK